MSINDGKGYHWPTGEIDPGEAICIKAYVPNAPEYLAAFWDAYGILATWLAWAKEDTHTAKDVAAVWRVYFDQARQEYEDGEECGAMFDVRANPENLCELQKLVDGEWVTFWDTLDCVKPSFPVAPPYPVPVGPDHPSETSAANIINYLAGLLQDILDQVDAATPTGEIVDSVAGELSGLMPGVDWWWVAWQLVDEMAGQPYATATANLADPTWWQDFYEEVACKVESDGSLLDQASQAIFDFLNNTSEAILHSLNDLASFLDGDGWTRMVYEGMDGGAGFGPSDFSTPVCTLPAIKPIWLGPWHQVDYINTTTYPPAQVTETQSLLADVDGQIMGYVGYLNWVNIPAIRWFQLQGQSGAAFFHTNYYNLLKSSLIPPDITDATGQTHVYMYKYDYGDGRGLLDGNYHAEYFFPDADAWVNGGPKTLIVSEGLPYYYDVVTEQNHAISAGDRHAAFKIRFIYLRS